VFMSRSQRAGALVPAPAKSPPPRSPGPPTPPPARVSLPPEEDEIPFVILPRLKGMLGVRGDNGSFCCFHKR
jgi:hypothetical protein